MNVTELEGIIRLPYVHALYENNSSTVTLSD